ncbi:MAG: glycosyl hydrolase [Bacteroidota bacterium]
MNRFVSLLTFGLCSLFLSSVSTHLRAQKRLPQEVEAHPSFPESYYDAMQWRCIGPYRGGRSCTVAGVPHQPNRYYFGATGGGVWKTEDGGRSWEVLSDGYFGGSIGAIAVSEADPNVIYVGGGEQTVRGNVSSGSGVWKSVDAGATWTSIGLPQSRHISRIRIHPQDPNLVYVAVLGNLYQSQEERGVYRSKDGGASWEKILYANADAGAIDLTFDPTNPRILYASTWRVRRTPHSLSSGGEGSGLWKSTDSGDTWTEITDHEGLPEGPIGIAGIAVSPVNPQRVWAIIEAPEGGVFRSEDGGQKWKKINGERSLRQRAWYYTRIYADPQDEDLVYVLNVRYHKSKDGGKTFKSFRSPHSDHHDLWIAPENPQRMVIADDGGAQVTYDGGETWSTYHNQPTAQFYRVNTDDSFPYRIYAAQQDNSTIRIRHRSDGGSIGERDWEPTAGGESAHIAVDPLDNEIVYGGSYGGFLTRMDHRTGFNRAINVWPDNPMGYGAEGMRYRFQWNFPIFFSPHQPKRLYAASNHLHVSEDEGQSWTIISPDLTRNDSTKLRSSGGPITQDNTSVEYYCTIFSAVESPRVPNLLWVGSDDGLVHLSRDGGQQWKNVSPPSLPEWSQINSIEADPFHDGGCYLAATRYKLGDFQPYLFYTRDFGQTWTRIDRGIGAEHFTRVIRADPQREGLLYAGTEHGVYLSFDNGANWQPLQLNLPIVPITDLVLKNDNLIAATQGRSLWIIDDLTPLHQVRTDWADRDFWLYQPQPSYRMRGSQQKNPRGAGLNHPGDLMVYYYLSELTDSTEVVLSFHETNGDLIRSYSNQATEKDERLDCEVGSNLRLWDKRYPGAKKFEGMVLWWASLRGPRAVPGDYQVRLMVDSVVQEQRFEIVADPRSKAEASDFQAQFDFIRDIRDKMSEAHQVIIDIREIRGQLRQFTTRLSKSERDQLIADAAAAIDSSMTAVEEQLYQTKNRSPQDPLNYPIKLTNKLGHLNSLTGIGDYPPTAQALAVKAELEALIEVQLERWALIQQRDLPAFNRLVREQQIDLIALPPEEP